MPSVSGFRDAAVTLFREAFEGIPTGQDYTWFVQGKEGIFDALTSVDAGHASQRPSPTCASIAAHAHHLLYILRAANTCQGRPEPEGTWESTWAKQTVTVEEWQALIAAIREEYKLYVDWLSTNEDWSGEDAFISALTPVPHVAYHLGAVRQILQLIPH